MSSHKISPPIFELIYCYFSHLVLIVFGFINDFLRCCNLLRNHVLQEPNRKGYPRIGDSFSGFYYRNIMRRCLDMWCHPICSTPGVTVTILERKFTEYCIDWKFTGNEITAINMGSYNYLGYAQNQGPITDNVEQIIKWDGIGVCTSKNELGTHEVHRKLEMTLAQWLGVDDSFVVGMGFATNSTNIPALFGPGCLILSDELNHRSVILGQKLAGVKVAVFKHNDMNDLEMKIRNAIISGQGNSKKQWKKIIIMVEGVYSMEGTIVNLPELIRIKKKYKIYIYLDEAHSIGALGSKGKGVVNYFNCNPHDVDVLMGTFTKSFGAAGGYIAGRKELIDYLRVHSCSSYYATAMSPVVAEQIISTIEAISNKDGSGDGPRRIKQLAENTKYFRSKLTELGYHILGNDDSPVVPIMTYLPAKIKSFIAMLLHRGIATTGAGFPITNLNGIRARFCLSAEHTKEMLDKTIEAVDEVGKLIRINYNTRNTNRNNIKLSNGFTMNSNGIVNNNGIIQSNGIMNSNGIKKSL